MGALLERRTDYEDKNRNRKTRKRNDFTDLQYFHNLSVCMDDLSALKTKAEIMDVRSFFRQNSSGITFTRSFLNHRFFDMSATVCLYQ